MSGSILLALVLGSLVYVVDRDWAASQFLAPFADLQPGSVAFFGPLGQVLPSFFHAYAFALLLILAIGRRAHAGCIGASAWFICAASLEIVQAEPVHYLFRGAGLQAAMPLLSNSIQAYVVNGHFDPGDLLATAIGCATAWAIWSVVEESG